MMPTLKSRLSAVMLCVAGLACVSPTDRSQDLEVVLPPIPDLLLKDSVALDAHVLNAAGDTVRNAVVAFSSSDPTVFSVDTAGTLRALSAGTASLTATAIAFADAMPFSQDIRVRDQLEVDSIRPANVRFGEFLNIYGVGLDTATVIALQVGGVNATEASFTPSDAAKPQGAGVLRVWVPPPARRRSTVNVIAFTGVVIHPESLTVAQRDLYEPNDTVPAALGPIPTGFRNPALAFEAQVREQGVAAPDRQPADWYTFQNTATQDRTIIFFSENVGAQSFGVFLTDSLRWRPLLQTYDVGPGSWTIGLQSHLCGGLEITRNGQPAEIQEVLFPITILALKDLPAGTYHLLAPYFASGQPASYELFIGSEYLSLLPPDQAEENDYCDVAAPIPQAGSVNLTIDNPHDIDWFTFTIPGGAPRAVNVSASTNTTDADLDLYLVRDFRPDSLILVDVASAAGNAETISAMLPPGNYFLIVVDFPGVPASYTLTTSLNVVGTVRSEPSGSPADRLAALHAKRARHGPGRPSVLGPRPRHE